MLLTSGVAEFWGTLGPWARSVVLLLGALSVLSIAVLVERGAGLWMARRDTDRFVPLARAALSSGLLSEVVPLAEQCSLSPEAELLWRSGVDLDAAPVDETEATRRFLLARWGVERYLATLNLELRRGLPIVGTIAATAPFVGLFGTVLGIIRAFQSMGVGGSGLAGVSKGIAEALVTTALGLFVAIPATWAYNFVMEKVDAAVRRTRLFGAQFLEALAAAGGPPTRKLFLAEPENPPSARFSRSELRSEINVTPLVDVVLVLLIIFMVVMPAPQLALDLGISRTVRAEAGRKESKKEQVLLRVNAENQVFVNDEEVPAGALQSHLRASFKDRSDQPLFFEADAGADYPRIVQILDECKLAGVENIAIVSRTSASP